jgi:hypothetical protein
VSVTQIHPGPDQTIGDLTRELEDLDLVHRRDFWLHYTWDLRPYIQTTPDAYEVWESARADHNSDDDDPDDADPDQGAGSAQTRAARSRRAATKRR